MALDCPLCDGLGMIDDPLRPGRVKKCPECDTPPSPYFLPLSAWVGEPEPGEVEHFEALRLRRLERERAENAAVAAHAAVAGPDCRCRWCTVQPRPCDAVD